MKNFRQNSKIFNLSRWYKYVPCSFIPSLSQGNLVYCRQHVTALCAIRELICSKGNSTLKHLLAMERNFTFVAGITDSSPDTISTEEGAYSVVSAINLGVEDFMLYTIEFRF